MVDVLLDRLKYIEYRSSKTQKWFFLDDAWLNECSFWMTIRCVLSLLGWFLSWNEKDRVADVTSWMVVVDDHERWIMVMMMILHICKLYICGPTKY